MTDLHCPQCSNVRSCTPSESCWCTGLPALLSPEEDSRCLCKSCLITALANKVNQNPTELSADNRQKIADLGPVTDPILHTDYNLEDINGQRLLVFSSWYLLRRGHCCKNNCRNCPYPKQKD